MLNFVYDLSSAQMVGLLTAALVGFAWFGTIFLRPFVRSIVRRETGANDIVGYLLSAHGVYFGILLGLLALSAYENFAVADGIVADEAAKVATLYTDLSGYPEPVRSELREELRAYTKFVITESWPQQQRGLVPRGAGRLLDVLHKKLIGFEPTTKGQEITHTETLRQFNGVIEARRKRHNAVVSGLPPILWYVVWIGVGINMLLIWLLEMKLLSHLFLGGITSFFLAALIALVASTEKPFRGETSVSPESFQIIYDSLMTNGESSTGETSSAATPVNNK
jgi:Protein of unknown function (DUF4239)